ncbi:MAG TPA: response regulator, partial [Herpetosiphonaceae bacterium]
VVVWSEGKNAYEFVRDQRPDALILDLRMEHPQAGWIIIHMLRLNPQTAHVPVLVCTGDLAYVQMRRQILRDQRCDVLLKPFSVDELLSKVSSLLDSPSANKPDPGVDENRHSVQVLAGLRKRWRGRGTLFQRMGALRRRR